MQPPLARFRNSGFGSKRKEAVRTSGKMQMEEATERFKLGVYCGEV